MAALQIKKKVTQMEKKQTKIEDLPKIKILEKYKLLEEKYNKLKSLKEKCDDELHTLCKKIEDFESQKVNKVSSESQTSHQQEEEYECEVCGYVASTKVSLQDHIQMDHERSKPDKTFKCRHCHIRFSNKNTVMDHVKDVHTEYALTCKFYKKGICKYSSDTCWYLHSSNNRPETLKCRNCENVYSDKRELMSHRKENHKENIGMCKKYQLDGKCKNGERCWYVHKINEQSTENNEKNDNQETNNMLKYISERMLKIERDLNTYMTMRCKDCGE